MKIRQGFVSNSSSTSFTFCFKGNKLEDLYTMISKYSKHFDLEHEGWDDLQYKCNSGDIVKAIKGAAKSKSKYDFENISVVSIDDHIVNLKEQIVINDEAIKREQENKDKRYSATDLYSDLYSEWNSNIKDTIAKMRGLQKKGLTSICEIGFGDNHGQISGLGIGSIMDYEGRCININTKDFAVMTEQNR